MVAGVPEARPDLLTLLQDDPSGRFTTLLAAIDAAPLSKDLLSGDGPFTLLAPTNDAFAALFSQLNMAQDQLFADRATLTKILLYHVVPGQYFFRDLTGGPTLPTELLGESVTFDLTAGVFTVQGANIGDPDNLASNGIMHAIDSVMLPPDVAALTTNPRLRFAEFSLDAQAVDFYINGQLSSAAGVQFPTLTAWTNVTPGTYEIGVAPVGGDPVATVSVTLAQGDWVTVAVTGTLSQNTLRATALREDYTPLADGMARLSMFNGVEGSPSYNVTVDDNTMVVRLGYPGTQGNNDGFFSADVAAGTYTVRFVLASKPSAVAIDVPNVTFDAGNSYFVAAVGQASAPGTLHYPQRDTGFVSLAFHD